MSPRIDHREIISLYREGMLQREVADHLGCHVTWIGRVLRRNGIRSSFDPSHKRKHPNTPYQVSEIRAVVNLKGKKSASQIAAQLGLSRNAVIGIWNRHAPRAQVSQ